MMHATKRALAAGSLLIIAGLITAAPARAADAQAAGAGVSAWKTFEFPGIAASRFVQRADGQIDILSDKSSAMLYRPLSADEGGRRFLSWRWRVDAAPPPTDLTRRGGDRPVAIHLCFKGKPQKSGFFDWVGRAMAPDVDAFSKDHRCLTYVWGGNAAGGRMFPNPYMKERGYMVVLRGVDAPTGEWVTEKIDCAKDYREAFGEDAPKPTFIAISGDSDETESRAAASIAGLSFIDH